ncbi:MAG TPA: site-specific integrase [Gaiellales bacterium]|jgi:integrase|nr:site-specific integrase [Gaiellales bacterium]
MSVQKRVRGNQKRWVVRWREGGQQLSRTFDRKEDADTFERETRRRAQMGAHAPAAASTELLGDYLRGWWATESPLWARSTRLSRAGVLDLWIKPYLKGYRLRDLGASRVREWRADIVAAGAPNTQANHALSVLSAALGCAVRDGKLPANPCQAVRRLPVLVERPHALAPIDVERIRAAMPTMRDVVLVGLLAYAGLRPAEAFALTWDSVTDHLLVIDRSFTAGEMKATKTRRRRTVELVAPLTADLALLRPKVTTRGELVAANHLGEPIDLRLWRRRVWQPACATAKVDATPYDGRHTFASLLIHEGRSIPYVAAALGHSSAATSLTHYAHIFDEGRLGTGVEMAAAIQAARGELERSGVRPVCAQNPPRVLRRRAR